MILAFSDTVIVAIIGTLGVSFSAAMGVVVAAISRTRKVAGTTSDAVEVLKERLDKVEKREIKCLQALSVSHYRIAALERKLGIRPLDYVPGVDDDE